MIEKMSIDGLSSRQESAIVALLTEHTINAAASAINVSPKTIYRWFQRSEFQAAYRRARRDSFSQAVGVAQRYAALAVTTLVRVMSDPQAPHHAKVSAALGLLRFGRDGIELEDLAARIEALEQSSEAT